MDNAGTDRDDDYESSEVDEQPAPPPATPPPVAPPSDRVVGGVHTAGIRSFETAKTNRAVCWVCSAKIPQHEWKINYQTRPGRQMTLQSSVHLLCAVGLPAATREHDSRMVHQCGIDAQRNSDDVMATTCENLVLDMRPYAHGAARSS